MPVNGWLQDGLSGWARDVLTGQNSRMIPGFSEKTINDLLLRVEQGSTDAAGKVWLLIVLEFWLQAWDATLT